MGMRAFRRSVHRYMRTLSNPSVYLSLHLSLHLLLHLSLHLPISASVSTPASAPASVPVSADDAQLLEDIALNNSDADAYACLAEYATRTCQRWDGSCGWNAMAAAHGIIFSQSPSAPSECIGAHCVPSESCERAHMRNPRDSDGLADGLATGRELIVPLFRDLPGYCHPV